MFYVLDLVCHVNEGGRGSMCALSVVKVVVLVVEADSPYTAVQTAVLPVRLH